LKETLLRQQQPKLSLILKHSMNDVVQTIEISCFTTTSYLSSVGRPIGISGVFSYCLLVQSHKALLHDTVDAIMIWNRQTASRFPRSTMDLSAIRCLGSVQVQRANMRIQRVLSHYFWFSRTLGLVNGPRLDGTRHKDAENDATDCVHSGSDKEYSLPRLARALQPTNQYSLQ